MSPSIWFGGTRVLSGQPIRCSKFDLNLGDKPARSGKLTWRRELLYSLSIRSRWRNIPKLSDSPGVNSSLNHTPKY
jgi:hypothetical protein